MLAVGAFTASAWVGLLAAKRRPSVQRGDSPGRPVDWHEDCFATRLVRTLTHHAGLGGRLVQMFSSRGGLE